MENVPGLATMHDGQAIIEVCETCAAGGYDVSWEKLDAVDFGVARHRDRVFVIGKRIEVVGFPEEGNRQLHIGAKPVTVEHPEFFRERQDLNEPDQATLDAFGDDYETLDELVEQVLQEGIGSVQEVSKPMTEDHNAEVGHSGRGNEQSPSDPYEAD
jgi:DNA (cytosine-5)-methyltransferase 1